MNEWPVTELARESDDGDANASPGRSMVGVALLVFVVFYLAEPHSWRFSASDLMHLDSTEESISERIQYNITKHQSGSNKRRAGVAVLGAYGAICLLRSSPRRVRIQGALGWIIVAFLIWSFASILWSADPLVTVRRLFVLGLLCTAATGIAKRFTTAEVTRLALLVTGFMMVGGLVCELGLGSFRPWAVDYRFSGFTWPAFTCWNLSLFALAILALARADRQWMHYGLAALATALALLTKTRAGSAALALALVFYLTSTWSARSKFFAGLAGALVVSAALLAVTLAGHDPARTIFRSVNLGREESAEGISGRAGVWSMLLPYIAARPLHGYGYESFWTPEHLHEIGSRNWGAPDAHNGYINLTLGVGVIGAGLYATALLLLVARSRNDFRRSGQWCDLYPACVGLITAMNTLCVASQLNPHVMSFVSLLAFARMGLVQETSCAARTSAVASGGERRPAARRPAIGYAGGSAS